MSAHGGARPASLAAQRPVRAELFGLEMAAAPAENLAIAAEAEPVVLQPSQQAFRNFGLKNPAPAANIYRGLGTPWENQVMLSKLMQRMSKVHHFGDGSSSEIDENFNLRIPAGYTYLGQFAAHDIIRNSSLLPSLNSVEVSHRNLRERSLCLDSLYGRGPQLEPALYDPADNTEGFRATLRMSSMDELQANAYKTEGKCPFGFRDIPRFGQPDLSGEAARGRPEVLIPDSRNDDNAMVAQVTALFHHLHNAIVVKLRQNGSALPKAVADSAPRGLHLFLHARRITTRVYRRVLRDDLLKRLLCDEVWNLYSENGFAPLIDKLPDGVPVEFSHAAYRLGHSMVRMSYVFNDEIPMGEGIRDALMQRSATRPYKFPLTKNWIADWSRFFELGPNPPQPSRRIGPSYNRILLSSGMFGNTHVGSATETPQGDDLNHLPDESISGLLLSDLVRGVVGELLTLDTLIAALPQQIRDKSPLLSNAVRRRQGLQDWLADGDVIFTNAELEHLSTNPPLLLWLLYEAAIETRGQSLGTLGSLIVGDVFMARLTIDADQDAEVVAVTDQLAAELFRGSLPPTMPDVIRFIAAALGLNQVMPAFLSPVSNPS